MPRLPDEIPLSTLRLMVASGIGPATFRKLMERFDGDHDAAADASIAELRSIPGLGEKTADSIHRELKSCDPERERAAMVDHAASLILLGDADYPSLLATIHDPPPALWVKGAITADDQLSVAIVGSRECSAYGIEQAARFSQNLAQAGLTIVSGGARGIDGEAHRAALRVGGRTIVVLGCGVGHTYPPEHAELFASVVAAGGAVISEQPTMMEAQAKFFPSRNRIISGLSLGVLVIEAARRSGALITARVAAEEHHREVMAIPGRLDSPSSAGSLRAVRDGWAALVLDHSDVLQQLESALPLLKGAILADSPLRSGRKNNQAEESATDLAESKLPATLYDSALSEPQRKILTCLEAGPCLPDQLAAATELPLSSLLADVTMLQIRGLISREGPSLVRRRERP